MDPELVELFERLAELNRAEAADLLARLRDALTSAVPEGSVPDADTLSAMQELADAIREVSDREQELAGEEDERAARARELLAEAGVTVEPDAEPQPEVEAEPAEGEVPQPVAVEGEPAETVETEPLEAVAAAATATVPPVPPARASLRQVASRLPAQARPRPRPAEAATSVLVAAADLPGIGAGQPISPGRDLMQALVDRFETFEGMADTKGQIQKIPVARGRSVWPPERTLDSMSYEENMEKIRAVTSPEALAASGGLCAPVAVSYNLAMISDASTPLANSLPGFNAARGGIRYVSPPKLTDSNVAGAVGVWTEANDISLNSPATKAISTVACGTVEEVLVDAVTKRMKFGNFNARYFPEQYDTYQSLIGAAHARRTERHLLTAIGTASTAVTHGQYLGAARDYLAVLDLATAAYRDRHRMRDGVLLRHYFPRWFRNMIRADLARQMPGDSSDQKERLAVADAEIDAFFARRDVVSVSLMDKEAGATWAAQGVGALLPWPTSVTSYLFHEGAFIYLDGGVLDLGLVRDSALNPTNDFETFSESFQNVAFVGVESLKITTTVCASGAASGLEDTSALCATGS